MLRPLVEEEGIELLILLRLCTRQPKIAACPYSLYTPMGGRRASAGKGCPVGRSAGACQQQQLGALCLGSRVGSRKAVTPNPDRPNASVEFIDMGETILTSRRAVSQKGQRLEYFTIAWNLLEGLVAVIGGCDCGQHLARGLRS